MSSPRTISLLPDAGPLISLAYADALDILLKPGWPVMLADMVLHEVTRNDTPISKKIASWVSSSNISVVPTRICADYEKVAARQSGTRKNNLGELAIQEIMSSFALREPPQQGVFLFEDHKIARAGFLLPDTCHKVSTRAFLIFLEQKGLIESAAQIERAAIQAGRAFSSIRFPA